MQLLWDSANRQQASIRKIGVKIRSHILLHVMLFLVYSAVNIVFFLTTGISCSYQLFRVQTSRLIFQIEKINLDCRD